MEAIVLAGGLGTRLRSVVSDVPKPMAPVNGKPFLEYILRYLSNKGITKVVLSVGYKWEVIQKYFSNKFLDIELIYSVEDEPLGTGGAIKQALSYIDGKNVYIINGDTFFNVPLQDLYLKESSKMVLSLKPLKEFDRYGCVEIDKEGYIIQFTEKGYRKTGNINGGVYLVRSDIFGEYIIEEKFSFEEFMQQNFKSLKASTQIFDNYFIDIGIPEDYEKVQDELKRHL